MKKRDCGQYFEPVVDPPIPSQVAAVKRIVERNALAAGFERCRVYTSYDDRHEQWIIGDNIESGIDSLVYEAEDKWFYRSPLTGVDVQMKGHFAEAMQAARMFFTG
jgi:hypothetical protein